MSRARRGALAILFTICAACTAACTAVVGPDAPSSSAALFDRVWSDFDLHYSLFGVKGVNWDSLGALYRPHAISSAGEDDLSSVIQAMLATLHDDHVLWRGNRAGPFRNGTGFSPTVTYGRYISYLGEFPGGVSCGLISPTIGYIAFSSFDGSGWLSSVDTSLALLGNVNAIVVDVRNNDGGFLENAIAAAGRFADRRTTVAYVRYRNGPAHTDFTDAIEQQVAPAGTHHFAGNVYLLTSRNTVSAAELFVLSMHTLGHTVAVGDTTAGETGSPFARELQNGWTYQFPESIEFKTDGTSFEDIGLPPDQEVRNTANAIARLVDSQLERAIALANASHP